MWRHPPRPLATGLCALPLESSSLLTARPPATHHHLQAQHLARLYVCLPPALAVRSPPLGDAATVPQLHTSTPGGPSSSLNQLPLLASPLLLAGRHLMALLPCGPTHPFYQVLRFFLLFFFQSHHPTKVCSIHTYTIPVIFHLDSPCHLSSTCSLTPFIHTRKRPGRTDRDLQQDPCHWPTLDPLRVKNV